MRALLLICCSALSSAASADVTETLNYSYYEAKATQSQPLVDVLNSASPHRIDGHVFHAMTNWTVNWKFEGVENSSGKCRITRVFTELSVDIDLPRLSGASPTQAEQFDQYLSALRIHELGHYAIAKEAAAAVDDDIRALPESSNCEILFAAANEAGNQAIENYKQKEVEYDTVTDHGRTQGAWLDE
jgi:predicted secreted Zn-dependent protease